MLDFENGAHLTLYGAFTDDTPFAQTAQLCRTCHSPLEIHYCEGKVYAVRCRECSVVSVVASKNPKLAAMRVGYDPAGEESEAAHE